ncbi:hypothetical protein ACPOL_5520 [Acidisarcina polymorpha]|uniref:Uncharacterized protein n=1 Tax=Acidisarcina polymorpha TaxID=2211140 RepID=A0A2Z5G6Y3_9BACT|nr:hypothetical protein ACPOL_5520 [Acidisarcina polymorpha]
MRNSRDNIKRSLDRRRSFMKSGLLVGGAATLGTKWNSRRQQA